MSSENTRPGAPHEAPKDPTDTEYPSGQSGNLGPGQAEEYSKYREAELEEERRLKRYEQTSSTDTEHQTDDEK